MLQGWLGAGSLAMPFGAVAQPHLLKQAGGLKEVRTCTVGLTEADQRIAKLSQGIGSSVAIVDSLGGCDGSCFSRPPTEPNRQTTS